MTNPLSWEKLLSSHRVHKPGGSTNDNNPAGDRTPFEADYDRVVFSEAFRRLAKKTQVHPLAPNDHVHNRLTHSIEVASVGRSLGRRLEGKLKESGEKSPFIADVPCIIQAACLSHDIGNPPFGHAGESAIRQWFLDNKDFVLKNNSFQISKDTEIDALNFEGNAQGFRLASRWDNPKYGYMRLTFATLGAAVKYPWSSASPLMTKGKYNYFCSERDIFDGCFSSMGLKLNDNSYARHPLSFLTEVADDICYRTLDMEDAVSMKIVPEKEIRDIFNEILGKNIDVSISELRGRVIGSFIDEAWRIFNEDYTCIMQGGRQRDLRGDFSGKYREGMDKIGKLYEKVFSHRAKVSYELGAYKILGRIMHALCRSIQVICEKKSFDKSDFISRRCIELAWGSEYAKQNEERNYEWWLRQVIDFTSGLTDNYAIQIGKEVEGL